MPTQSEVIDWIKYQSEDRIINDVKHTLGTSIGKIIREATSAKLGYDSNHPLTAQSEEFWLERGKGQIPEYLIKSIRKYVRNEIYEATKPKSFDKPDAVLTKTYTKWLALEQVKKNETA